MRKVTALVFAGLLVLGVSACTNPRDDSGKVTQSASAHALSIKVGDCVGSLSGDQIEDVQLIPCGDAHYWEAYSARDLPAGDFPGETEIGKVAAQFCGDEFTKFVGVTEEDSQYTWTFLSPSSGSWNDGDREIMCIAGLEDGGVRGSLKNVNK